MKKIFFLFLVLFLQSCTEEQLYETGNKTLHGKTLKVEIVAHGLTKVDNLYLGDNDSLYATLERSRSRGELVSIVDGKTKTLLSQLDRPDGLAGKGRYLFVTEEVHSGRIIRYDLQTGNTQVVLRDLRMPEGIDLFINGDLAITEDVANGRLLRLGQTVKPQVLLDNLARPEGLCIDHKGTVFVALTGSGEIISYQQGKRRVIYKGLSEPDQVECAADGSLWITEDQDPGRLLRLENGVLEVLMSGLSSPQGIAFHTDGSVYIAEQGKDRIIRLSWH